MKTNFIIDISPPISYLVKFWFSSYGLKCCWPVKLQKFSNISRQKWMMKFFGAQINTKVFQKLIVSLWLCIARHVQSSQNNKFAIFLQYLKENVKYGVDFSPKGMSKVPKITSLLFLCNILRINWVINLIFYIQINMKVFYKLILWFLMRMVKNCKTRS